MIAVLICARIGAQVSGLFSAVAAGLGNASRGRGRTIKEEEDANIFPQAAESRQAVSYDDL